MERTNTVFYKSFFDAIMRWPEPVQLECFQAIGRYAFYGEMPKELSAPAATIFDLVKPQIDANNKKYEDGKKGGSKGGISNNPTGRRGKGNTETTSGSSMLSTTGSSGLTTTGRYAELPNVNVNVNVNEKANEKANEKDLPPLSPQVEESSERQNLISDGRSKTTKFTPPTEEEVQAYIREKSYDNHPYYIVAEEFIAYYEMNNWVMKNGKKMSDWRAALRYWAVTRKKNTQLQKLKRTMPL